jgi:hypothetical protein
MLVSLTLAAGAKKIEPPPESWVEHVHPTGAFSFRTPPSWRLEPVVGRKEILQTSGEEGLIWFLFRQGESGFDSLHVSCMAERLAGPMETDPRVRYEYDFRGAPFAGRAALDSAFLVRYDQAQRGALEWHQRNLTVVGAGQSLCVIVHSPLSLWKKSKDARLTLDRVVESVTFHSR